MGLCTTNLSNDNAHCGACDRSCPSPSDVTHNSYLCLDSKCQFACFQFYADCNASEADGCETYTYADPANCGACGNACDPGVLCWQGACGCPNGYALCNGTCVSLSTQDNCGACDKVCAAPTVSSDPRWLCGPDKTPPHTAWLCGNESCELRCTDLFANCDPDFCGNGCERDVSSDPNNCGACGNTCGPCQQCYMGQCLGSSDSQSDLLHDPLNCNACDNACPGPYGKGANGAPTCVDGQCGYTCYPHFADCDHRVSNGCEVNLWEDPNHCGSCDTRCDLGPDQACVEGVCLTKPCNSDAGIVR